MNERLSAAWRWLRRDAYERFWNFETLKGLLVTGIGIYLLGHPEYALKAVILFYCYYEGPRKILANRVKQRAAEVQKAAGRSLQAAAWPVLVLAVLMLLPRQETDHLEPCDDDCSISQHGIDFIRGWEGYVPIMYQDAAGYWTIGTGHLMDKAEIQQWRGKALTAAQGDSLLRSDLTEHVGQVNRYVVVELWPWQFDAFVSLDFNIGPGNFRRSSALRYANARAHDRVPERIKLWNRAGGRVLRGLVRRREAEARMYATGWSS